MELKPVNTPPIQSGLTLEFSFHFVKISQKCQKQQNTDTKTFKLSLSQRDSKVGVFQTDSYLFCFLGSRFSSSSKALSLFFMAATFSSRLICPELLPVTNLVLFASGSDILE